VTEKTVDLLIVGQGVAGSALAWQALRRHLKIHVISSPADWPPSASQVGAGLITPITGSRLALAWRFAEFRSSALDFYRFVANETKRDCWRNRPALRWLTTAEEELWLSRCQKFPTSANYLQPIEQDLVASREHGIQGPAGTKPYVMPEAARVHLPVFLEATEKWLMETSCISRAEFKPCDLLWDEVACHWKWRSMTARRIVLCTGYTPELIRLPFLAAKGELMEIDLPGARQDYSWHGGIWMTPQEQGRWLVGATYDPLHLDHKVTSQARLELSQGLAQWSVRNPQILSQQAAIRPAVPGQIPVIGWSLPESILMGGPEVTWPQQKNCGLINGLGSRGALWAPLLANWLLDAMAGQPLPPEIDLARFLRS
jgi:glycine/D-amino acid oxidase-like deaminating enzyme